MGWGDEAEAPALSRADAAELAWWRRLAIHTLGLPRPNSPLTGQRFMLTRAAELPDFEPSSGHRHGCQPVTPLTPDLRVCDCSAQLYAIAAQAEEKLALQRPAEALPDYCLVARLDGPDHAPFLCQRERGHDGAHLTETGEWRHEWLNNSTTEEQQ